MCLDDGWEERLDRYTDLLVKALRATGWCGSVEAFCHYCLGLLLPGERKSMEPIAARLDPEHVQACYSSIQRLITDSVWDHQVLLDAVRTHCLPLVTAKNPLEAWIVDDTTFPKKGDHSVGVAHQYCGNLGKQENCQDAVTISLANHHAGLPVAYRLYLPEEWTDDPIRCKAAGVPASVTFKKKWEIALDLVDHLQKEDVPQAPFLGDAGFGGVPAFRQGLTERGFRYVLGIRETEMVWPPGWTPLPPRTLPPGREGGRAVDHIRQNPAFPPLTAKEYAKTLSEDAWRDVPWRQGTAGMLRSRFSVSRVRPAAGCYNRKSEAIYRIPEEEWLIIEWPEGEPDPTKYWLATVSVDLSISELVDMAKLRWRIEQDYEDLKQEVGLGDFEGRTWQGFHHHASLSIAAYAFLVAERARLFPPIRRATLRLPESAVPNPRPWRRPPSKGRASQSTFDYHRSDSHLPQDHPPAFSLPVLRTDRST